MATHVESRSYDHPIMLPPSGNIASHSLTPHMCGRRQRQQCAPPLPATQGSCSHQRPQRVHERHSSVSATELIPHKPHAHDWYSHRTLRAVVQAATTTWHTSTLRAHATLSHDPCHRNHLRPPTCNHGLRHIANTRTYTRALTAHAASQPLAPTNAHSWPTPHRNHLRPHTCTHAHATSQPLAPTHVHPRPTPHRNHLRSPTCTYGPSFTANATPQALASTYVHLRPKPHRQSQPHAYASRPPPPTPTTCLRITSTTANATHMPMHHDQQRTQLRIQSHTQMCRTQRHCNIQLRPQYTQIAHKCASHAISRTNVSKPTPHVNDIHTQSLAPMHLSPRHTQMITKPTP